MPWQYCYNESWNYVFKHIKDKTFFCKVIELNKNPILIKVDGKVPQFKQFKLIKNNEYKGIIIKKNKSSILVDFGFHFNWSCGSFIQHLRKKDFENYYQFSNLKCGNILELLYQGKTGEDLSLLKYENEISREDLIGKTIKVKTTYYFSKKIIYIAEDKYLGIMTVTKNNYQGKIKYVKKAIKNLTSNDTITCEVIGISKVKNLIELKWIIEDEMEEVLNRKPF